MLDLVILLSLALAITAVLGLLLASFVWIPWLVGVLLVALLIALVKLSSDEPELDLPELNLANKPGLASSSAPPTRSGRANLGSTQASSSRASQPAATASVPPDSQRYPNIQAPDMVYRGVKYRRPKATADDSNQKGLYRGQPWQR